MVSFPNPDAGPGRQPRKKISSNKSIIMKNTAAPNKLTEGPIVKSLLALSIPIVFANILHTAYQLTDTFWVGRIGQKAVAAVSLSFPIIFLLISLGGGLAIAGTILVAQYKGKGDKKSVDYIASQTIIMMCFTLFSLLVLFLILNNLGTSTLGTVINTLLLPIYIYTATIISMGIMGQAYGEVN